MSRAIAAVAALLLLVTPALAARPPEISGNIKADQPYGAGTLSWLFISVYDAALWTDAPKWSMQAPFALTLTYRTSLSSDDLLDSTVKEMGKVDPGLNASTLALYREAMTGYFPAVKPGDTITALYTPDGTLRVFHNGKQTGIQHDRDFAKAFFDIWLSPATSEPGLRAKLLRLGS